MARPDRASRGRAQGQVPKVSRLSGAIADLRIAILVLAHRNDDILRAGVRQLAESFDVYLHFDRRSPTPPTELPARVRLIPRRRVYHGSYRQILATLDLFRHAATVGYDRYVLVSGQDLPLASNRKIRERFAACRDVDCITFVSDPEWLAKTHERLGRFHPDRLRGARPDTLWEGIRLRFQALWCAIANRWLDIRGIERPPVNGLAGGPNWMDLTHATVEAMLRRAASDTALLRRFRWTRFGDEHFFHTVLSRLDRPLRQVPVSRYVDWTSGPEHPRLLRCSDLERLGASDALFARKFDSAVDGEVVLRLLARNKCVGSE